MRVGILQCDLFLPKSTSLKHRRMIMNSIKGKIRSRFNVSVSEIDYEDIWQRARLAVCHVTDSPSGVDTVLTKVMRVIESFRDVEVTACQRETL